MGSRVQIRISFRGIAPAGRCPQGASRKLCSHLHDLDGFGTDEFPVQKLVCQISHAIHHRKLLGESTDTDRAAGHDQ